MKEMLPFYGMGLLAVAMAIATQGQAVMDGKGVEKEQPQTERSQPSPLMTPPLITQPLTPNPQPVLSKGQSNSSPFAGMSDQAIVNQIAADLGVQHPPTVVHACSYHGQSGFRGLSVYAENKLVICLSSHSRGLSSNGTETHVKAETPIINTF